MHRFNRARGIVESHSYSYLTLEKKSIVRELPLETPTEIELCPNYNIRVTLFDANHCPGSTMFLVEGEVDGENAKFGWNWAAEFII